MLRQVAPLVGAWIEIVYSLFVGIYDRVAPLVGAWIEIVLRVGSMVYGTSLPSWERGLKSDLRREYDDAKASRSPRGSVD